MMQFTTHSICLLAARQDLHRVWGRFDNERPSFGASQMLMIVAALVLLIGAALVWRRVTGRTSRYFTADSSAQLFRELCGAHGLRFSSRRLLKRLALARGITNPALLFVEPRHFDTRSLPDNLKSSVAELRTLRDQLFG